MKNAVLFIDISDVESAHRRLIPRKCVWRLYEAKIIILRWLKWSVLHFFSFNSFLVVKKNQMPKNYKSFGAFMMFLFGCGLNFLLETLGEFVCCFLAISFALCLCTDGNDTFFTISGYKKEPLRRDFFMISHFAIWNSDLFHGVFVGVHGEIYLVWISIRYLFAGKWKQTKTLIFFLVIKL